MTKLRKSQLNLVDAIGAAELQTVIDKTGKSTLDDLTKAIIRADMASGLPDAPISRQDALNLCKAVAYSLLFSNADTLVMSAPYSWTLKNAIFGTGIQSATYSLNGTDYYSLTNGVNSISIAANSPIYIKIIFSTGITLANMTISGDKNT